MQSSIRCTGLLLWLLALQAHAEGHGPLFGLATPTLGQGQWSSDTAFNRTGMTDDGNSVVRQMFGYGVTEDFQFSLTGPLGSSGRRSSLAQERAGAMMGGGDAIELSALWRFHRTAPHVGARRESTLLVGVADGAEMGNGRAIGPTVHIAAVTGFASRTTYWWLGAGVQRDVGQDHVEQGDLVYATAVFGWRPPLFRGDYPSPDWRVFAEAVAENSDRDRMDGMVRRSSGGTRVLVGPSVLGLFGRWGMSAGVLVPVHEELNGVQPETDYRAKLVFTYWF